MLEFIRERAQGWIAWTIVILIIIPFALWGVNQYFGGGRAAPVAEVDGVGISQAQVQNAYYRERQRLQEQLGANFNPDMFPEELLRQQVLQQLIREQLLVGEADSLGLRISDLHLARTIRSQEAFLQDGRFDQARYERLLAQQGMQPSSFENRVRRDLLTQQLYRGLTDTAVVTDEQVDAFLRLNDQQRHIGYVIVPSDRFADEVAIDEQAIRDYYEQNRDRYVVPERVTAAYIDLDIRKLQADVEVDEETLRSRYEARQQNYRTPEQRRASHILIAVDADASAEREEEAKRTAEEVLAKLGEGADFAELAKEYSDDPGSAQEGGDLGFFERGAMVPAFEEAVFAMQEGETSGAVRSEFGYHIIRLDAVRESDVRAFEEVRDEIREDVRRERAEEVFYDMAERLANLTYEHPDALEPAAEQLGLPVEVTEPFSRQGGDKGLAAEPKVVEAAFSEEVLSGGHNSEPLELGSNRLVVLRVREHFAQSQQPLEAVSDQIGEQLKRQRMAQLAAERAEALAAEIAEGAQPSEAASSVDQVWQEIEDLDRRAQDIERDIVRSAFELGRPSDGEPTTRAVALPSGDQAVVALFEVRPGDTDVDAERREQVRELLSRSQGEAVFSGLIEALRARADIETR